MSEAREQPRVRRWVSLLPILLALPVGWMILKSGPVTAPVDEERPPKVVKTISPQPASHPIFVTAHGSVIPARRVTVEPQVGGDVVRLHADLLPGGYVAQGEELYGIDPVLKELDLKGVEAELRSAKAVLAETRRKWLEGQRLAREKVIPVTELASLEAAVRIQEAELGRLEARQARDEELLRRHSVLAPFNAIVLAESVDLGQRVAPGDTTVTLVGADEFWVQASLPADKLQWVRFPTPDQPGSDVRVLLDTGDGHAAVYEGQVLQLLGDLAETGRMARVLVRVANPLQRNQGSQSAPLLLGSYVRVEIAAGTLENVLAIDRTALREGDRIWVVDTRGRLQIRDVKVRWRKDETIYLDQALQPGEALVVSDLRVALPDMEIEAQPAETPEPTPPPTKVDS